MLLGLENFVEKYAEALAVARDQVEGGAQSSILIWMKG
jgi:cobalamin-dependent methionine synthase I